MNDLNRTIDWSAIDYSQVMAEDCGDDERNMDFLLKTRAGVQFVPVVEADEIVAGLACPPRPETIKAVVTAYQELVAVHGPENVITICPFKDKPAGVKELNNAIRASLGFDSPQPRVGDFLMIMRNQSDCLNGERYRAVAVAVERKFIEARLIGTRHEIVLGLKPHDKGPCKDVDWGYAATVHKYQGSEASAAIVVIPSGTLKLMKAVGGTLGALTKRWPEGRPRADWPYFKNQLDQAIGPDTAAAVESRELGGARTRIEDGN